MAKVRLLFIFTASAIFVWISFYFLIYSPNLESFPVFSNFTLNYRENTMIITSHTKKTTQKPTTPKPSIKYPQDFEILLDSQICPKNITTKLLILVTSAVDNFEKRQTIRETWGSTAIKSRKSGTNELRIGFFVGNSLNQTVQSQVFQEFLSHRDIILADFVDNYFNLTHKSVNALKWTMNRCMDAEFLLKVDDDMFVNVPKLQEMLLKMNVSSDFIAGHVYKNAPRIKNKQNKLYVPIEEFSGNRYPRFVSGTSYVVPVRLVPLLHWTALGTSFIRLEDVFLTGVCAEKAGIERIHWEEFTPKKRKATFCAFKDNVTGHWVTPKDMRTIWGQFQDSANIKC